MRDGEPRSPCHECIIHLRGISKLDPALPCAKCRPRLDYVAAIEPGPPTAPYDECVFNVATESFDLWSIFYAY